jgi:Zn-dependent protease
MSKVVLEHCAVCGAEEFIPYVCRYCGGVHCVYHRLPENHECPNIAQARAPRQTVQLERRRTGTTLRLIRSPRIRMMPGRELLALSAAWIVLGISFTTRWIYLGWMSRPVTFIEIFLLTLLIIGTGFLGHELAHKFTAQRYGAWAEFRLWTIGAIMALIFAAIPPGNVVFAAPGAVYIASRSSYIGDVMDRKTNGIISLVGPMINVGAAAVSGLLLVGLSAAGIGTTISGFNPLRWAIQINLWLGAFNMIPFFILDGQKVLSWNKTLWALITIPLWTATALSIVLLSP